MGIARSLKQTLRRVRIRYVATTPEIEASLGPDYCRDPGRNSTPEEKAMMREAVAAETARR